MREEERRRVRDFLRRHFADSPTPQERRIQLMTALGESVLNQLDIDFNGAGRDFADRLLIDLLRYNRTAGGEPVVAILLEGLLDRVGTSGQNEIVSLSSNIRNTRAYCYSLAYADQVEKVDRLLKSGLKCLEQRGVEIKKHDFPL